MRVRSSSKFKGTVVHIFALGHYKKHEEGNDEFSKIINGFYIHGYSEKKVIAMLLDMWKTHFDKDSIKWDILTLCPTHNTDGLNSNMHAMINELSGLIKVPYVQALRRTKTVKESHECENFEERYSNTNGSIEVISDVKGKNVIVVDNVSISGITMEYAKHILIEAGAKEVIGICLGLSEKERETDYDINRVKKASEMIRIFKTQKISKEKRDVWKKTGDLNE